MHAQGRAALLRAVAEGICCYQRLRIKAFLKNDSRFKVIPIAKSLSNTDILTLCPHRKEMGEVVTSTPLGCSMAIGGWAGDRGRARDKGLALCSGFQC